MANRSARGNEPFEFPLPVVADSQLGVTWLSTNLATGWLRAPTSNAMAFVYQSFLTRWQAAGTDLPTLMLRLLGAPRELPAEKGRPAFHTGRAAGVIEGVCKLANWQGSALPPGPKGEKRARGFGFYFCHRGYFAEVVDITLTDPTTVRWTRCGPWATSAARSSTRSTRAIRCRAR
jgi:isoquinoline 1-oxidoreductase beta subunit